MQPMNEDTALCPDATILKFLQEIGFDELDDLQAYSIQRTDCYFLALSIPIPKRQGEILAIIDFLFLCSISEIDGRWEVECIDGRVMRVNENGKIEVRLAFTQWARHGPFYMKTTWLEKLLGLEAGIYVTPESMT